MELLFISLVVWYFLARKKRRKLSLDEELRELVESSERTKRSAEEIRSFVLRVISDERNGIESFNDSQLAEAKRIIDKTGPGAFFWMTHIAAQLAFVSASQINEIPTNVDLALNGSATPEEVVKVVVQV
jgi:hypothetical protein